MHTRLSKFLIERHAAEIARENSQFKQVVALPWHAKWVGPLAPMFQEYLVAISFAPGASDNEFEYPRRLDVEVLEPALLARRNPPELIPHLYRQPSLIETPLLCLFWPGDREWDEFKSISDFVIPWTAEWLANYELWRVTGRWASPEAPHDVNAEPKEDGDTRAKNSGMRTLSAKQGSAFMHNTALPNLPYFVHKQGI